MDELIESCGREIPGAFESDDYAHRIEETMKGIQTRRQELTAGVEKEAEAVGFTITSSQAGITPVPLKDGSPMTGDDFNALTEEQRADIRERGDTVQHSISHLMVELRQLNKTATEQARDVDKEVVRFTLKPIIDELQEKYAVYPEVVAYLEQVELEAGEVQAIGGATQKIEGFYGVCKAHGLNGGQGVMIPRDNLKHLVLKDEVVQAVEDGKFSIYAVSTIDEGIEILTGVPAGEPDDKGGYPEGTVHYLVEQRLEDLAKSARQFGKESDEDGEDEKPDLDE